MSILLSYLSPSGFFIGVPSSMRVLVPSELCTLVSLLIAPLIERLFKKN